VKYQAIEKHQGEFPVDRMAREARRGFVASEREQAPCERSASERGADLRAQRIPLVAAEVARGAFAVDALQVRARLA
jgi:hypothetical protein